MYHTFSILFFIQKNKATSDGKAPIYLRITVNGKRSQISIKRKIEVSKWSSEAGRVSGTTVKMKELNHYMDNIKHKIYKIYERLEEQDKLITALIIKNIYLGKDQEYKMILKIFQDHNDQVEKLVGKDFAAGTAERYRTAKKHLAAYIELNYKQDDIPVKEIDHKFISGFEYYLKTERNCAHNSAIKYITNFKKIVRIAFANDWISKDPFYSWKAKLKVVDREFLSKEEVQAVIAKDFKIKRLDLVRDIFIFSCYTGLAYADVKKLRNNDVVLGIDRQQWIKTKRAKTDTRSSIPILPYAEYIMEKYQDHPDIVNSDLLLPILSNQKMNAYLKEIADVCGITKNLTFHLARHTFATTITLTNGVPLESVSKMLGHKSIKTTQHYAKILDRKVSDDMQKLRELFSDSNSVTKSNKK